MSELVERFASNPIVRPADVRPSRPDLTVGAVLNPGAFRYRNRIGLLLRVAERPRPEKGWISTPVIDPATAGGIRILRFRRSDPHLKASDPRVFEYKGRCYLTTLSHLRLAWSDDGVRFAVDAQPTLSGMSDHETFGIEDCRVEFVKGRYWLTFSVASAFGVGVGLISTARWKTFTRHGLIFPPHNKDCALFPQKIAGSYWALHRPSGLGFGGNDIWLSRSPDLLHWGEHRCLATTRPGQWDSERIGAGAAPIKTARGWLAIYHGADARGRYCLGALLLDLKNPARVRARSRHPIMEPVAEYEQTGFFGNVVFTNGHVVAGDTVTIYYGASDTIVCGARASIKEFLDTL